MSKGCLVVVIAEDEHHEMLARRYLKRHGLEKHEIRIERSPSGQGSAEHWVRKRFVIEVSVFRSRHAQTKLIVIIDADAHTVQSRVRQLDQALTDSHKAAVDTNSEQIARLVPKRNVETWILCLNGHLTDEETDYKRTRNDWSGLIPPAAETLFQWTRPNTQPPQYTDSLQCGVSELKRLRF